MVAGSKVKRRPQKRLDYLLRYRRDFPIAVVEAKSIYAHPGDGLQKASEIVRSASHDSDDLVGRSYNQLAR